MKKYKIKTITYRLLALLLVATTVWSSSIMASFAAPDGTEGQAPVCGCVAHTHTQELCYTQTKTLSCELEEDSTHTHVGTCYAYENKLVCELTECETHTHEDECYTTEKTVSCGKNETAGHTHGDTCYGTESILNCTNTEVEHEHDTACWSEEKKLVCQESECEAHNHEEACYIETKKLSCGKEETSGHTHGDACYEQQKTQICEIHIHDENCYLVKNELNCQQVEHTHSEDCYDMCTCTPVDGVHREDCALYEPICTCDPAPAEGEAHSQDCVFYVPVEQCEYCGVELTEGAVHSEDCLARCACTPVDGVHQEDCELYEKPELTQQVITSGAVAVSGNLPEMAELAVRSLETGDLAALPTKENEQIVFAYDISILVDGADYQPETTVEVTVPLQTELPEGSNWTLIVQHIADNGSVERVPCRDNSDGTVTFWADGFSTYVGTIVQEATVILTSGGGYQFYSDVACSSIVTGSYELDEAVSTQNIYVKADSSYTISAITVTNLDGTSSVASVSGPVNGVYAVTIPTTVEQSQIITVNVYFNGTEAIDVNFALLEWKSKGCVGSITVEIDGASVVVSDQASYDSAYGLVYAKMLANATKTYADGDSVSGQTIFGDAIWKINGTVSLSGSLTVSTGSRLVILCDNSDSTKIVFDLSSQVKVNGGAFSVQGKADGCRLVLDGGGAFTWSSNTVAKVKTKRSTENMILLNAGNMYLTYTDLTNSVSLNGSTSTKSGAIFVSTSAGANAYISDFCAYECLARSAGVLYASKATTSSEFYFYNCEFFRCVAYGAINNSGGAVIRGGGSGNYIFEQCKFHDNLAMKGGSGNKGYDGGGVVRWSVGSSKRTSGWFNNCIFYNNTAIGQGGAILASGGLELNSCKIYNNNATKSGGGVFAVVHSQVTQGPGNDKSGSVTFGPGTEIYQNAVTDTGGLGGGIHFCVGSSYEGTSLVKNYDFFANINGASIHDNAADNGGGIAMTVSYNYECGVYVYPGSSVCNNTAVNGGAVYIESDAVYKNNKGFHIEGGTVSNNTASKRGGAVYIISGNATVDGGTIHDNQANDGGGIYVAGGELSISGGAITSNSATNDGGGAYISGGDFTLNGASALVDGNAAKNGAGVYLTGGTPNLLQGAMKNNVASANGGGIYIDKQLVTLKPSGVVTISGNKAEGNGAGIYIGGTTGTDASFAVDGSAGGQVHLTGNGTAATDSGGAVCIRNGQFTMDADNITITGNQAANGGGVAVLSGNFSMSAGSIGASGAANQATNGGGVFVNGGTATVSGGTVQYNEATNGGGACVENGSVVMSGGTVNGNKATNGAGGGMYVSAAGTDVSVAIYSGSVSNNTAKTSGGALAVSGTAGGTETIAVTLGVNKDHSKMPFDHEETTGTYTHATCPVIENNSVGVSGGAVYITGGQTTQLNIFCLEEGSNQVGTGDSLSNFMMVEGGTVVVSTSKDMNTSPSNAADSTCGKANVTGTVHVLGGDVSLYGAMTNPKFNEAITVDVLDSGGSFNDYRYSDEYYKLIYFENFKDPITGKTTGQYTAYQVPKNTEITISGVIYSHPGYEIVCWYTKSELDGNGERYEVGETYSLTSDLTIYAIWEAHGYTIEFAPNVPLGETYTGVMPSQTFNYNVKGNLMPNTYRYPGYIFTGWKDSSGNSYVDGAEIFNLTTQDGAVITLCAQWVECKHDPDESACTLSYTKVNEVTLRRDCSCEGQTLHAVLSAENAVYDGNPHRAECIFPEGTKWPVTLSYTGMTFANVAYTGTDAPTEAGNYIATLTATSTVYAQVPYTIAKAEQPAPEVPTFVVEGDVLTVATATSSKAESDTAIKTYYQLFYYDTGEINSLPAQTTTSFTLPQSYTSYYVVVWYGEGDNHNASSPTRSKETLYYRGTTKIEFIVEPGILHTAVENTDSGGVLITVQPDAGYYLTKEFQIKDDNATANIVTKIDKKIYNLVSIPEDEALTITVTISGAKKAPVISGTVTENQVFGTVSGTSENVTISRDSAFTACYAVSNYDATAYSGLNLAFSAKVPTGTTIILLNKADKSYWYYNVDDSVGVDSVPLTSFTRMGGSGMFAVSRTELAYQFIVDFSRTAAGCSGATLTMSLTADPKDTTAAASAGSTTSNVPELKGGVKVTLVDTSTFSMAVSDGSDSLIKTLTLTYKDSLGAASKWDNRNTAVVLTPVGNIPSDATLLVTRGSGQKASWPMSGNGSYIIPLSMVRSETLNVELVSALFPTADAEYRFTVQWIVSNSKAAKAPMNGETVASTSENVIFKKSAETIPSMKITEDPLKGSQRLLTTNDTLQVIVAYELPTNGCTVTADLLRKDDATGLYNSTAWRQNVTSQDLSVPLAAHTPGSFCLMLTMKQGVDTILQVPYYFIIQ